MIGRGPRGACPLLSRRVRRARPRPSPCAARRRSVCASPPRATAPLGLRAPRCAPAHLPHPNWRSCRSAATLPRWANRTWPRWCRHPSRGRATCSAVRVMMRMMRSRAPLALIPPACAPRPPRGRRVRAQRDLSSPGCPPAALLSPCRCGETIKSMMRRHPPARGQSSPAPCRLSAPAVHSPPNPRLLGAARRRRQ